jgi:hypothetical protein
MALTLSQGKQLRDDLGYRDRLVSAIARYAVTVMAEAIGAQTNTVFAKRKLLANRVLTSPSAWIDPFLALYSSDPGASLTWYQPVNIASSTNANPSVVTTATAHGLAVGDVVEVQGHLVNTAIVGVWTIATVGSSTTFTVPHPANGVGGATGTAMKHDTDITLNFTVSNNWNPMAGTYTGEA